MSRWPSYDNEQQYERLQDNYIHMNVVHLTAKQNPSFGLAIHIENEAD